MKTAYLDCFSGISGDMFLGALLDAGLPFERLEQTIRTLPFDGYSLEAHKEKRNELTGTRFIVRLDQDQHHHRGLKDIIGIINQGDLSEAVKEKSIRVFESIAREEGRIHGQSPGDVHFHEVGAVDSIIDIVGTVFGLEFLNIGTLFSSPLPLGTGFIESSHGRIPVPAPATIALLKDVPVYDSGLAHELVTPTGAALIQQLADGFGPMPPMTLERTGYGVGTRDLPDRPNLFRIIIGREQSEAGTDTVVILEANLDDTNPEWSGFLMEKLFQTGALDVVFCPIQMKKNRPGIQIQVMGKPHQAGELMDALFRESTTLGIRFRYSQRKILERSPMEVEGPFGTIQVTRVTRPDGSFFITPEYEACRTIAETRDIPLREIYYWVMSLNNARSGSGKKL